MNNETKYWYDFDEIKELVGEIEVLQQIITTLKSSDRKKGKNSRMRQLSGLLIQWVCYFMINCPFTQER